MLPDFTKIQTPHSKRRLASWGMFSFFGADSKITASKHQSVMKELAFCPTSRPPAGSKMFLRGLLLCMLLCMIATSYLTSNIHHILHICISPRSWRNCVGWGRAGRGGRQALKENSRCWFLNPWMGFAYMLYMYVQYNTRLASI